jgi:hypothetical protein
LVDCGFDKLTVELQLLLNEVDSFLVEEVLLFVEVTCEFVQVLSELEQTLFSPGLIDLCRSDRVEH